MFASLVARVIAFVVGDLLRVRRAHVEASMVRAGVGDIRRTARAMYRDLARGLVELLAMTLVPGIRVFERVLVPHEVLRDLEAQGTGAVVLTAHTGNWDLCACAIAQVTPISVVTKRLSVGVLDALWQGARRRRSVKLLEIDGAARQAIAALRRREIVAMLVDQAPERSRAVVTTGFLGAPARVDVAPALVAMRARVPLVVAFPRRTGDGWHTVDIVSIFSPPRRPTRAWAESATIEATKLLEHFVRRHPEQWLWMHRRWKTSPNRRRTSGSVSRLAGESP